MAADWLHSDADLAFEFVNRRTSSAVHQAQIDFSPLADMVFQLLTFFIMTVRLANQQNVDLPSISIGEGLDVDSAAIVTILAPNPSKGEAQMFLGDDMEHFVSLDELPAEIQRSLEQTPPKTNVIIKAERLVQSGVVLQVSRIVAELQNRIPGLSLYIGVRDQE